MKLQLIPNIYCGLNSILKMQISSSIQANESIEVLPKFFKDLTPTGGLGFKLPFNWSTAVKKTVAVTVFGGSASHCVWGKV